MEFEEKSFMARTFSAISFLILGCVCLVGCSQEQPTAADLMDSNLIRV